MTAAGKEVGRLAHQICIAGEIDLTRAGSRAAADLIEQARPCAAFEKRDGARADQKRALQRRDGSVDRAGRSKRSEISHGPRLRAAMVEDLGRPMSARCQGV